MMTAILQCPNAACGRVSHLGDDPLGRIFRCPHCLIKLPTASASAADAGWTAVGPPRLGAGRVDYRLDKAWRCVEANPTARGAVGQAWKSLALGSGEVLVTGFELGSACDGDPDPHSDSGLGPDDSGEVLILPVLPDGGSDSAWGSISKSSISAAVVERRVSGAIGSNSRPALGTGLGRFRILSLLGEGEHAAVYRAYDPILERDVALKVPRQAVLKTTKVLDRFLGEAKALARLRHPRIVPVYEAGCAGGRH
jgi:hypothetical protein